MGLLDDIRKSLSVPTSAKKVLYDNNRAWGMSSKAARKAAKTQAQRPRPTSEQRTAWRRNGIL